MFTATFPAAVRPALAVLNEVQSATDRSQTALASGRRVNTAADSPALWAISATIEAEQAGFTALSETLAVGKATLALGRTAAESVVSALREIRAEVILANAAGADLDSRQAAIGALSAQIGATVAGASFNGVNLLQNASGSTSATFSVLGGVYTGADGTIQTQQITVAKRDLQTAAAQFGGAAASTTNYFNIATARVAEGGGAQAIDIASATVAAGASYRISIAGDGAHAFGAGAAFEYVARLGDTRADVAQALYDQISAHITGQGLGADVSASVDLTAGRVTLTNLDADAGDTLTLTMEAATGGSAGGGLDGLSSLDVTSAAGRDQALATVDTLLERALSAATELGSAEKRADLQSDFIARASRAASDGIGALVNTDLAAESARLQALTAQRELAISMLSIANQRAESILRLFE